MDDALLMGRAERFGNLPRNRQCHVDTKGAPHDSVSQRWPLDKLHDDGWKPIRFLESVHLCDLRMIEAREQLRFSPEARELVGIAGDRCRQELDGDVSIQVGVSRPVDFAHSPGTKGRENLVWTDGPRFLQVHLTPQSTSRVDGILRPTSVGLCHNAE